MEERPYDAKRVGAWCLYDFANSVYSAVIPATVFSVYYTAVVVGNEEGRGDFWWGVVAVPISTLAVALSSPIMGSIADRAGIRRFLFALYTALSVTAVALFTTIDPGDVVLGCALFIVANFAMEGAIVFYNAYLPEIVPVHRLGRVSAWGFGVGYIGSILGLLAAVKLAETERFDAIWLMVAALFAGFALPAILVLGPGGKRELPVGAAAIDGFVHVRRLIGEVLAEKPMRRFLFGYFLYINGVNAAIVFAGPFAKQTFGLDTPGVIKLFLIVQVSALVGAFSLAKATDTWGPKRVVQIALCLWLVTIGVFVMSHDVGVFRIAAVIAGLGLGTVQSASRAFMATLIPKGREDEFFGFYALCGKTAAPLGTLVFGLVSSTTGNQRFAVAALSLFFISGFVVVTSLRAGGPTTAGSR
jgi:UMF1 family MFS transporter